MHATQNLTQACRYCTVPQQQLVSRRYYLVSFSKISIDALRWTVESLLLRRCGKQLEKEYGSRLNTHPPEHKKEKLVLGLGLVISPPSHDYTR